MGVMDGAIERERERTEVCSVLAPPPVFPHCGACCPRFVAEILITDFAHRARCNFPLINFARNGHKGENDSGKGGGVKKIEILGAGKKTPFWRERRVYDVPQNNQQNGPENLCWECL